MKQYFLWIGLFLLSIVTMPISFAEPIEVPNLNDITIELNHENYTQEGTSFSIYSISEKDYQYALSMKYETSVEKAKNWLKKNGSSVVKEVVVSSSNKVTFNLPRYDEQKNHLYYVIIQNKPDREGINGKEIYESFPSFISLDQVEDDFLVIQTKRVFIFQTPYLFKYSAGTNQKPLKGAEFVLYRLTSANEKEYLVQTEPVNFGIVKQKNEAWAFTSDEDGLVVLPNLELSMGTYYFEEIKAPTGYEITEESKKIPLIIKEDPENGLNIIVNGELIKPVQAGELPQEVLDEGRPRVLNKVSSQPPGKENPPTKTPTVKEPSTKPGFLPKTGEEMMMFSSFGLLLMLVAFKLMKRGKENE